MKSNGCTQLAEWMIHSSSDPINYTYACTPHVGEMLDDSPGHHITPYHQTPGSPAEKVTCCCIPVLDESLYLQGESTDHIWLMEDGKEPHVIGVRMDCGDSGAVYLTREQAKDLSAQLSEFINVEPVAK